MDVTGALAARRTVRAFRPDPVPQKTLRVILEAALHTPSWANTQPWQIYAVGGDRLERMRAAYTERTRQGVPNQLDLPVPDQWPPACRERTRALTAGRAEVLGVSPDDPGFRQDFIESNRRFFGAPCVVYLCMDRCLTSWSIFDLGMMAQSIMLAAQDHGLDSAIAVNLVWYPDVIRAELGVPEELIILIGIALGYPDRSDPSDSFRSSRRPFDDVVKIVGIAPTACVASCRAVGRTRLAWMRQRSYTRVPSPAARPAAQRMPPCGRFDSARWDRTALPRKAVHSRTAARVGQPLEPPC
jgi:nitroreductase